MSDTNHEAIYNQDDMDNVLTKLRSAEKDAEQSKQLLWAVVDEINGEISIPYDAWLTDLDLTKELLMWDDPATLRMYIRTREVKHVR